MAARVKALERENRENRVDILIPLLANRERVFIRQGGRDLGWAELMPMFAHGDRAGAKYQAELESSHRRAVARLATNVGPPGSTFENQKAAVERIAPNAPAPAIWPRAIDKTAKQLPAELEAEGDARNRAILEDHLAVEAGQKRRANGGNR